MKRVICLLLISAIMLTSLMLSSCSFLDGEQKEIAMVTDGGSVNNSSLNQAVWSGVVEFATANTQKKNIRPWPGSLHPMRIGQ